MTNGAAGAEDEHGVRARDEVRRALRVLVDPDTVFEVRAIFRKRGAPPKTYSGYFDDPDRAVAALPRVFQRATGIYVTLNPVQRNLLARCANRLEVVGKGEATGDDKIVARRRLLIDIDATPDPLISSSDAEHDAALALAVEIRDELRRLGWPEPILGDSGNGAHLVYAIDLPCEDDELVARFLGGANERWGRRVLLPGGDYVTLKVDPGNFNPARITKLFGTYARKGDSLPQRPHRWSSIIEAPAALQVVPRELLEAIAKPKPSPKQPARPSGARPGDYRKYNHNADWVRAMLAKWGVATRDERPYKDGVLWELAACPFNADHDRGEAHVRVDGDGKIYAGCKHTSTCPQWGWNELRAKFEGPKREAENGAAPRGDAPPPAGEHPNAPSGERPTGAWGPPIPLGEYLPPVPEFVVDLLPADLQGWVCDIAYRMSVPIDLPAVAAMVAVSVVAANARTIHPKRRDPWRVWPILWGVGIAPPGSKKTPSMNEIFKPLQRLDVQARQDFERARIRTQVDRLEAEARLAKLKELLKRSVGGIDGPSLDQRAVLLDVKQQLSVAIAEEEHGAQARPRRFLTQDATVEKITDIVGPGAGRRSYPLCVKWDELLGFFQLFEREGREGDRAFYLEGWSGGADRAVDRISRGSVLVRDLALIVFGNATPEPFEAYVREAARGHGADGLLQRFQLMVYPDPLIGAPMVDEFKDAIAERRASALFERLAAIDEDDDERRPPALRFADDAQEFYVAWQDDLQRGLARVDEHVAVRSHFAKYASLMPALALVCHLASGPGSEHAPVNLWAAQQAAGWCDYLRAHAVRIYSLAVEPERAAAVLIADKIAAGALVGEVTVREVYRKLKMLPGVAKAGLELLDDLGWVRMSELKTGGRKRELVAFNPGGRDV